MPATARVDVWIRLASGSSARTRSLPCLALCRHFVGPALCAIASRTTSRTGFTVGWLTLSGAWRFNLLAAGCGEFQLDFPRVERSMADASAGRSDDMAVESGTNWAPDKLVTEDGVLVPTYGNYGGPH